MCRPSVPSISARDSHGVSMCGAGRPWVSLVVASGMAARLVSIAPDCCRLTGSCQLSHAIPQGRLEDTAGGRAGRILSSLRLRLGNIDHRGSVLAPSVPRLATILQLEDPLLSFGSAYTWSEDLHLASGMSCPAHTAALPAGTLQSEAAQCFPSVCMHSLGLHIIGNINEMACDLSRNPACGHYY